MAEIATAIERSGVGGGPTMPPTAKPSLRMMS
jgi:hypothetical protein